MAMDCRLTGTELLRIAGGDAYLRGMYTAVEGLGRRFRRRGDWVLGRDWLDSYRTRLLVVSPFSNTCTCKLGGGCRHVVTLGLSYLYAERRKQGITVWPQDEWALYDIGMLRNETTFCRLVMQMVEALPEAREIAERFFAKERAAEEERWRAIWAAPVQETLPSTASRSRKRNRKA